MRPLDGALGGYDYSAAVPVAGPFAGYTAHVILHRDGVAVTLEASDILWRQLLWVVHPIAACRAPV